MSEISKRELLPLTDEELNSLKSFQRKYVELATVDLFEDNELRLQLGLSKAKFDKYCKKDPLVLKYLAWCRKKVLASNVESQKAQRDLLNKKLFESLMESFEDVDRDELPLGEKERILYLKTKVAYMPADKRIKSYMDLAKLSKELTAELGESGDDMVERIRHQAEARRREEKKLTDELSSHGMSLDDLYNMVEFDGSGNVVASDYSKEIIEKDKSSVDIEDAVFEESFKKVDEDG